ncbi:MAG: heavy-metal-associated domain-containing protein [Anaerolineae bacterium]|nr:heavy-metal-associated domain-containing protein [Anaerolineae bacterium]
MEKVVLDVPTLWADHHVLKVREALLPLEGVKDVYASSAWKKVLVSYDPGKVNVAALEKALADANYPVGEGKMPMLVQPTEKRRDPAWAEMAYRVTETNRVDLEMSGEFRRY